MRVTERELKHDVELLQKRQGIDIDIHWAYGQPRCTTKDQATNLSPRLPKREMAIWLHGFGAGITAGSEESISLLKEMLDCGLINESWGEMFDRAKKAIA